ncbi:hypothetical protein SDJN02_15805, partial [Cucurbita argyrosperma subsp. argyrosperma]
MVVKFQVRICIISYKVLSLKSLFDNIILSYILGLRESFAQ